MCVDVGSTWTKALLVDVGATVPTAVRVGAAVAGAGTGGRPASLTCEGVLATAQHRTTVDTDVMDGVAGVLARLGEQAGTHPVAFGEPLVCSSAGGGLRLAVVGYELVVTAEAARRAAVSAGGRVVHLAHGVLDHDAVQALVAARPDVVVLTGGTDGGDGDVLLANAAALAPVLAPGSVPGLPVVLAGNAAVAEQAEALLVAAGVEVRRTANVLPRIGRLNPGPAREAVRSAFLRHVIGGDRLSRGRGFDRLVLAATPDAVLLGVQQLATAHPGGVLAVDVGGATTDVYSVLSQPAADSVEADVAGLETASRTVEGDLGMRWSAPGAAAAAEVEGLQAGLLGPLEPDVVAALATDPGRLADDRRSHDRDTDLAMVAAVAATRRHARPATPGAAARPLRDVELLVGSGGVLRHGDADRAGRVLGAVLSDHAGLWHVPDGAALAVDHHSVLCALGLLALADGAREHR
ncbi:glutamate mutase L [Aquipuribacter sp. MA13-6]|uniref:glutamate mutase L n=1 Tax=unclassified Aquipuribacter TaxID=2635084 RepID=UPI003EE92DFB